LKGEASPFFSLDINNLNIYCAEGKPEKVRTVSGFLEREVAKRKWRKTGTVVFSGLLFFGSFLLEKQKK